MKIPAEYAEAFYREAVATLAFAADNLEEACRWWGENKGKATTHFDEEEIPRVLDAIDLVERARNGVAEYGAEELVKSTIEGVVLDLGENMHGLCEEHSTHEIRKAAAQLEFWVTLLESEPMQEVEREREAKREEFRKAEEGRELAALKGVDKPKGDPAREAEAMLTVGNAIAAEPPALSRAPTGIALQRICGTRSLARRSARHAASSGSTGRRADGLSALLCPVQPHLGAGSRRTGVARRASSVSTCGGRSLGSRLGLRGLRDPS